MGAGKTITFLAIFLSLGFSIVYSYKSFTGYLVSDTVNSNANLWAFLFLTIGLMITWLYVSKFRHS